MKKWVVHLLLQAKQLILRFYYSLIDWWDELPVSKKLFGIVALMATLIIFELVVLASVMGILSSVRAFVGGEGLWSKAQKNAVAEIRNYAESGEEKYYKAYLEYLKVSAGDKLARLELEKPDMDTDKVTEGMIAGRINPRDIPEMIKLIRRFRNVSFVSHALSVWEEADKAMEHMISIGSQIRHQIRSNHSAVGSPIVRELVLQMNEANSELTQLEDQFTFTMGEAHHWVEKVLFITILAAILLVESARLILTLNFTKGLSKSLAEISQAAEAVEKGDFSRVLDVYSRDELGKLSISLNKMTEKLRTSQLEVRHAEEANQIKSLFLANMSHEIRTPLGAILGFIELLKFPDLSREEQLQYLEIIERTGNSLSTIINDILDISKVEAGKLEVNIVECNIVELVNDLYLLLKLRSDKKGISLRFAFADDFPQVIYSDPIRLRQILLNIVGNAIKFTSHGEVEMCCSRVNEFLEFKVTDTGPGISPDSVEMLFTPFSQLDLSIRKVYGGSGLGLTLSRELARLLDGDIFLEKSTLGQGSVFTVRILMEISQERVTSQVQAKPVKHPSSWSDRRLLGRRILVVDDSEENQIFIRQFLIKSGAAVEIAENGQLAIDTLAKQKFDLVIMDLQMPVMDGYVATEKLRQNGVEIPILGLTAHAMHEDLARALQVGCNYVVTKPITRRQIIDLVEMYCRII